MNGESNTIEEFESNKENTDKDITAKKKLKKLEGTEKKTVKTKISKTIRRVMERSIKRKLQ